MGVRKTGAANTAQTDRKRAAALVKAKTGASGYLESAPRSKLPLALRPMLATLTDAPFDQEGWSYEIKWDGYRTLAFIHKGKVELKSRNDKSFNEKFYPIYDALGKWSMDVVIDGEIVVVNRQGISEFGSLQNWRSEADGRLVYYVFDILWLNGRDLTRLPLQQRREILNVYLPETDDIRISQPFDVTGTEFYKVASNMGLEGIMAKRNNSVYHSGARTKDWLKIKANKRQEVVIGGFTRNDGTHKPFSSLLVGLYEGGKLQYTGKIGTGFNIKTQKELMEQFKPLTVAACPFSFVPDVNKPSRFRPDPPHAEATWLKPDLVCEVSFAEMTEDGVMRHPSFEGMRIDKNAADVTPDKKVASARLTAGHKKLANQKIITPSSAKERRTLLNPTEETQVKKINGHELKFTNLSKVYWPKEKVTKRDMINYYYQVAPYMLPYLKNRPQSLNRHPNGIDGESFYQKDVKGKAPGWVATFPYHSSADDRDREFLVCNDEATLLYMASLGCIEMNPWSSTVNKPDNPDWCIIDLDPADNSFNQVIEAAQVTHTLLEQLGVPSYCKTSGSTGLHIYIPFGAKYSYEQSKEFGRSIATIVQAELPKFTSIERQVSKRGGKMYIDFLQNRPQATLAGPYSLRPKPGATVSMPLYWEEVKKGLKMKDFTIFNALERLKGTGDIFKPVLGKGINLARALKALDKLKNPD
jgi:bifunctional non-homologous end joining protein LigD